MPRTIQSPAGICVYGTTDWRIGRRASTPISFGLPTEAFVQTVADVRLLQRDLLEPRLGLERRAVDEVFETARGRVALRIANAFELADLVDDGRNLPGGQRNHAQRQQFGTHGTNLLDCCEV
jgi:hypothetical protein